MMWSICTVLVLAASMVVDSVHGAGAQCAVIEDNTDYIGSDVGVTAQATADGCCADCEASPMCTLFVWVADGASGRCILKSSPSGKSYYPGARASKLLAAPGTCTAIIEDSDLPEDTDYIGNDIGELQLSTIDLCCDACSNNAKCVVFVWVLRDGVGVCILKSVMGAPSPFPGARASFPVVSTPAPTPSKCPTVEYNIDYDGFDILSKALANHADCCGDCERTPGCSLYVWSSGTCYLKSKKGPSSPAQGAVAAVFPVVTPTTPLLPIASGREGTFPLPTTAFNYIKGGQWIDQGTLAMVQSQVEAFKEASLARPTAAHEGESIPMFTLEAAIGLAPYINVTSPGDCAVLTTAYKGYFFTYLPSLLVCLVHDNTADTTLQMLDASVVGKPATATTYPQMLDDAFKLAPLANVATNADCLKACQAKGTCAGVVYSATAKSCTFFQPKPSTDANVVAGWVNKAIWSVDSSGVQYSRMPMATLPRAYLTEVMPGVATLDVCAKFAKGRGKTLFTFVATTKACTTFTPTASTSRSLRLINTPVVPVALSGSFGTDVAKVVMSAVTAADCYKLCVPTQSNCFGAMFDSNTRACTYLQPAFDPLSTLGWIIPSTLPTTMAKVSQVDFYITAHTDDHELFMSAPVYNSLKTSTTKSVFVYLSAGDGGQTNNWWQAREIGTVSATKTWINIFGTYSPVMRNETVLLKGHNLVKVTVGNAVHYFLRLSEEGLVSVIINNQAKAPLDQPTQTYANAQAVKDVLKAIIVAEATRVSKVTASYSKYLKDENVDHILHVASGRITGELLNADPLFNRCVSQYPYFGYQHWYDTVNMNDAERVAQRAAWVGLSMGILTAHYRNVWSEHAPHLGRTYVDQVVTKTALCAF
ncbi:hypothetical protein DYB32_007981 [Aphanomyces invadans]|uniref:Apple domain-containing protein n=1 Tax=Aphanomyces invadans TaxID=157072 RepID=A0A418AMH7_9STRA|nr:hypothetical protein DYB32_007981 [Aphanomyces invadans]